MSLTVPVAAVMAVVAFLARQTEGSWIAPAPIFAAFWAPVLLIAGLTFPSLDPLTSAALYILAAITAVWVGSVLGHGFDPPVAQPRKLSSFPFLRTLIGLSGLIGVAEITSLFWRHGYTGRAMFSLAAIIETAVTNRVALYAGLQQSVGEWAVFLILYTNTLLGGVLFRLRRTNGDAILALSAPIVLWAVFLLYGSRVSVLYGGAFWVAAYLATSAIVVKDHRILTPRGLLRTVALGSALLFGLSIVTQGVRYGKNSHQDWRSTFADGFDYPAAMGIWIDQRGFVDRDFTAGARTFSRVVGVVGITASPLPAIPVGFTSANIYTVFRDVIEDFGTIGSFVFFVALGWSGRVLYARARSGRHWVLLPLTALYAFLLTSPADDIFFYTISIAAMVLFGAYTWATMSGLRQRGSVDSGANR